PRSPMHTAFPYTTLFRSARPGQNGILHHKFDIDDTSRVLLQIKSRFGSEGSRVQPAMCGLGCQVIAHLLAHVPYRGAQLFLVALTSQDRKSTRLNSSHVKI